MAKISKRKAVNFLLLTEDHPAYLVLQLVRDKWHQELCKAKIALAYWKAVKADRDGILKLGRIHKASDLQRELVAWDFVILLNEQVWCDPNFTDKQKKALLDHELCHATTSTDKEGQVRLNDRGREIYRMRRHDIEEFRDVIKRHGLYKSDLEAFAKILLRKSNTAPLLAQIDNEGQPPQVVLN